MSPTKAQLEVDPDLEKRIELVRQHGSFSLAYSTLQPGMRYFDWKGEGFIAYRSRGTLFPTHSVLADPVVHPNKLNDIIHDFLDYLPNACFVQVSMPTVEVLRQHGYKAVQMGVDTIIDLNEFNLRGNSKEFLRRPYRKAEPKLTIAEEVSNRNREIAKEISKEWIRRKNKIRSNETEFLTRPANFDHEIYTRKMFALREGRTVGYCFFDPLFKEGQHIGYYADVHRVSEDAPKGTNTYLLIKGIEKFKEEGLQIMTLGLSPFYGLSRENTDSRVIHTIFSALYEYGDLAYGFKGQGFYKSRYRSTEEPVFFATRSSLVLKQIYDTFRMCKVL